ncbi:MAG: carbohydrate ABC transporter permease [Candidatus Omnitrophota bacterium]
MDLSELRRKKTKTELIGDAAAYILLSLGAVTMVIPFLWMIGTSLQDVGILLKGLTFKNFIPEPLAWWNYINVWKKIPFARFFINSIFVAVVVTLGQVTTSSLAAYSFSRLKFAGRDKLFFAYVATMMIPGTVTIIPLFILLSGYLKITLFGHVFELFKWMDTYKALTVPAMFSAYGTFMLRQFFMTLPSDLEDAAKIDGCSFFGIYWRIILPLSKPALATLITFTFMGSWGSFMWPLIIMNSAEKFTLPVGLAYFQGTYGTEWGLLMAGSVIVTLPIMLIFIFNQRFFVEGIKLTGIKG